MILMSGSLSTPVRAGALESYVRRPDSSFNWKFDEQKQFRGGTVSHLELISQTWRGQFWSHHLQVVRPDHVRNPDIALLFISGDGHGDRDLGMLKTLAERAGAIAAILTKVPNQPLYGGRKEDALIAYTFDQYLKTGDRTWPLLFPMVKSAVRAMDTLQAFAHKEFHQSIKHFVVSGASKRGWTTWLTGAADHRVVAIAPIVIDMLNMQVQAQWSKKVYGRQSEQIQDYTKLGLIAKMGDPGMVRLRGWVDPYSYRKHYTVPKLLLLGTNDRYWTVDSIRNYWNDLPAPKLIYQTPNAGHDLGGGKEAIQTLAAWFELIADHHPLPRMNWEFGRDAQDHATLSVWVNEVPRNIRLWTSTSPTRDFRDAHWTSRELALTPGSHRARAQIAAPEHGYRAYLAEVELTSPTGQSYRLSTEARVTPDDIRISN
jgi:PhoPQ-activated pathogenicity-related protein